MPHARRRRSAIVCLALLAACRRDAPSEIRVGVLGAFTGTRADVSGTGTREGVELAIREINARGGVKIGEDRRPLVAVWEDVGDGTDGATAAAQTLLSRPDVVALIGPQYSVNAIPVSSLAENAGVPMITPMGTHPDITRGKRWVFRIAFTDAFQTRALARFATRELHAARAAILLEESASYSRSFAEQFAVAFTAAGGTVVATERYTRDRATDFRPQLTRIAAAAPEILVLPNELPDDTLQMRQARAVGIRATFLTGDFFDENVFRRIPEADGAYTTSQWHPSFPTPEAQHFRVLAESTYGHRAKATAANTYDAVRLLTDAIERAGSIEPEKVRTAIEATRDFPGASGRLTFAGAHDPEKAVLMQRMRNGHLEVARIIQP